MNMVTDGQICEIVGARIPHTLKAVEDIVYSILATKAKDERGKMGDMPAVQLTNFLVRNGVSGVFVGGEMLALRAKNSGGIRKIVSGRNYGPASIALKPIRETQDTPLLINPSSLYHLPRIGKGPHNLKEFQFLNLEGKRVRDVDQEEDVIEWSSLLSAPFRAGIPVPFEGGRKTLMVSLHTLGMYGPCSGDWNRAVGGMAQDLTSNVDEALKDCLSEISNDISIGEIRVMVGEDDDPVVAGLGVSNEVGKLKERVQSIEDEALIGQGRAPAKLMQKQSVGGRGLNQPVILITSKTWKVAITVPMIPVKMAITGKPPVVKPSKEEVKVAKEVEKFLTGLVAMADRKWTEVVKRKIHLTMWFITHDRAFLPKGVITETICEWVNGYLSNQETVKDKTLYVKEARLRSDIVCIFMTLAECKV
ncbi:hypothetical protein HOY82DRAFT_619135 [Tuber indicum]|nr:hypothetical protein HOY82DRAFT_619135 [Tuber indicum]